MMFGLGAATTTGSTVASSATAATSYTFTQGLELWGTPSTAMTVLESIVQSPSAAFSSSILPLTLGVLTPPVGILALVLMMASSGKKGRR